LKTRNTRVSLLQKPTVWTAPAKGLRNGRRFRSAAGRSDIVGRLIELGHSVDECEHAGDTVLHHAVGSDEVECVDAHLYVIGSLGYAGARRFGETPVFRLDTKSMRIERVATTGAAPGWIYKHRANLIDATAICVTGGFCVNDGGQVPNTAAFILDLQSLHWRETTRKIELSS
jgi:hypothetical protein